MARVRWLIPPALALALASCSRTEPEPAVVDEAKVPASAATQPKVPQVKPPTTPESVSEIIARANQAAEKGETDRAVALIDEAVKAAPSNRQSIWTLAIVAQNQAMRLKRPASSPLLLKSADLMRRFRAASKDLTVSEQRVLGVALFNEACTYAIEGKTDRAIKSLIEAIDSDAVTEDMITSDDELAPLRQQPAFAQVKTKIATRARERAKQLLAASKPFRFGFDLPDLDGKTLNLNDLKGNIVIVDVWGTWCPPCREEIPHFADLYKRYHDKGLEIIGINYERVPEAMVLPTVRTFVAKSKVPYRCLIGDSQTRDQIPDFEGYPTTLFIDRAGIVRLKVVGSLPLSDLETIVMLLLDDGAARGERAAMGIRR